MTVYADVLFGLNTLINYLLLRGSAAMGGCPVKLWRLLGAAALGGLYAVVVVLPGCEGLQGQVFQLLCAALMVLTAFGWKRNTLKQGLFFFGLSFAFGGLVLVVVHLVEPDCLLLDGRAYYAISTPALLLLAGTAYSLAGVVLSGCGTHTGGDIVEMTLQLNRRSVRCRALRDTGNTLRDPLTGESVLIVDGRVLRQLLPKSEIVADPTEQLFQMSRADPDVRVRLIPYRAVGVHHGMLAAMRCRMQIKGKEQGITVAVSPTEVSADDRFDAIWGGEIL